jgi:hypothetical protein
MSHFQQKLKNSSKINISDQYVKRILEKIVLNEEGKNHYMWPYDFVKNHYMWPYDFITNLKVFFYYMTFYHKNTCTLWISIISDNYFKFNLKAESKFTYKKTIKKTISKLQLSLYNVPLIVMVSVYWMFLCLGHKPQH